MMALLLWRNRIWLEDGCGCGEKHCWAGSSRHSCWLEYSFHIHSERKVQCWQLLACTMLSPSNLRGWTRALSNFLSGLFIGDFFTSRLPRLLQPKKSYLLISQICRVSCLYRLLPALVCPWTVWKFVENIAFLTPKCLSLQDSGVINTINYTFQNQEVQCSSWLSPASFWLMFR